VQNVGETLRLKEEERQPIEAFSVQTITGKIENVPVTGWKDLVPILL